MLNYKDLKIINNDILKVEEIEENTIDLIVTSPPYNLDIQYNSNDDNLEYDQYLDFSSKWMSKCLKWLKPDGRFCLNVPMDTNKGGHRPTGSNLIQRALNVGFQYKTSVIWNKNNVLCRTAWGSWMSASAPAILAPIELISVFYKDQWKKLNKGVSTVSREEFIEWTNGLWAFTGESKKRVGHPAPFPVELPNRCIKMFTYEGDLVLDPFMGSGTTLIAAYENKRKAIGIELDKEYCNKAATRINNITNQIRFF